MKSVERVKAALEFTEPDRIPLIDFTSLSTIFFKSDVFPLPAFPSKHWRPGWNEGEEGLFPHLMVDMLGGYYKWKKPEWAKDPKYRNWMNQKHEEIDDWGCHWTVMGDRSSMGHPSSPSLPDWSKLDEYMDNYFPDPDDTSRFSISVLGARTLGRRKYRIMVPSFGPVVIASNMRGFNNFLIDHKKNPDKLKYLLEQITEVFIKMTKTLIRMGGKPHGFWLLDDLGTQSGPFMSPELFRDIYKSSYGHLIESMHDLKLDFHHHCCGKIEKLIPVFLDFGLDAIELDSPRMTGYPALRPFRGKLMFWCDMNIQSIYIRGTPEECQREVWHMMRNLAMPQGGFGAYIYPSPRHLQVPQENVDAFKRGIKQYGNYAKIPPQFWEIPIIDDWKRNGIDFVPPIPI
jgi:uroporphyrinogen decarboxylase